MAQGATPRAIVTEVLAWESASWPEPLECRATLLAESKPGNGLPVPVDILLGQIREEPTPLTNQLEQTAPRVKIVPVRPEVISKAVDSLGQQRDLHFRRTGVFRMRPEC